ncbi:hypothetical protein GCM10023331_24570 [Algivirga pacifica]|uniref:Uncharacterized protein n=2 Tax=Algivirga pacifica TaxID=1162670 RepID=A0ABP9DBA9_9BACT
MLLCVFISTLFSHLTLAQDKKLIDVTFGLSPGFSEEPNYQRIAQVIGNVSNTLGIGLRYMRTGYVDDYSAVNFRDVFQSVDERYFFSITTSPENNVRYFLHSFSVVTRANILPFRKINPYVCASLSWIYTEVRIDGFNPGSDFNSRDFLSSLRNAEMGYVMDSVITPRQLSDSSFAIPIPYKENRTGVTAGVSTGVDWNINRILSVGFQIHVLDLFAPFALSNLRSITFASNPERLSPVLDFVVFPNPEENEVFRSGASNFSVAYAGQEMKTDYDELKVLYELTLTFKLFYRKE